MNAWSYRFELPLDLRALRWTPRPPEWRTVPTGRWTERRFINGSDIFRGHPWWPKERK